MPTFYTLPGDRFIRMDTSDTTPFAMDSNGFIRYDARAGFTTCTPGKTVPCGKVCRTPANCRKGKAGKERVEKIGKENLSEFAKAFREKRAAEIAEKRAKVVEPKPKRSRKTKTTIETAAIAPPVAKKERSSKKSDLSDTPAINKVRQKISAHNDALDKEALRTVKFSDRANLKLDKSYAVDGSDTNGLLDDASDQLALSANGTKATPHIEAMRLGRYAINPSTDVLMDKKSGFLGVLNGLSTLNDEIMPLILDDERSAIASVRDVGKFKASLMWNTASPEAKKGFMDTISQDPKLHAQTLRQLRDNDLFDAPPSKIKGKSPINDDDFLSMVAEIDAKDTRFPGANYTPLPQVRDAMAGIPRKEQDALLYRLQRTDKIELSNLVEAVDFSAKEIEAGIPQLNSGPIFFVIRSKP